MKTLLLTAALGVVSVVTLLHSATPPIDSDALDRSIVVLLKSSKGSCTGVEVLAPSGKTYTLTARHCKDLAERGAITAVTEDGKSHRLSIVSVDVNADLMLLSGIAGIKGAPIADKIYAHEKVHTMGHGHGYPSYRTDGELLQEELVHIMLFPVVEQADKDRCLLIPKAVIAPTPIVDVCAVTLQLEMTTAWVVPGSSGGPLFDPNENIVGIVSAGGTDMFSAMVTLRDIQAFLKAR